jgi:hypothetical protein
MDLTNTERPPDGVNAYSNARKLGLWLLWPVLYLALRLAAPFIPAPSAVAGSIAATVVFLLLPLLWLRALSRSRPPAALAIVLFVVLALVWSEFLLGRPFGIFAHVNWRAHPTGLFVMRLVHRPVADLALITAAALLGVALAGLISDPKMLLPVVLVGALVDYWGVYMGTTNAVITMAPRVVQSASAAIPSFGGGATPAGLQPASFVGFGDWLFLAMFLTVAWRYELHPRRTFWALLGFLVPAMLIVIFGGLDFLPAVVPMALAIFVVNGRRLKLSRAETFATFYALLMVAAMILAYTLLAPRFISRSSPRPSPPPAHRPSGGGGATGRTAPPAPPR